MKARLREPSTLIALALAVVLAVVVYIGTRHNAHIRAPTSFAFNSLYEVRRGESYVNELLLAKQLEAFEHRGGHLGGQSGVKTSRCRPTPPPPTTDRLACSVVTEETFVHPTVTVTHLYRWNAAVRVDPKTGALSVALHGPVTSAPTTTP
jgi:hypothetical protein